MTAAVDSEKEKTSVRRREEEDDEEEWRWNANGGEEKRRSGGIIKSVQRGVHRSSISSEFDPVHLHVGSMSLLHLSLLLLSGLIAIAAASLFPAFSSFPVVVVPFCQLTLGASP